MAFGIEQLELNSEYEFDVTVEYEGNRYPGKLSLKRTAVHLTVYAESTDSTHDRLPWQHIARVECPDFRRTITLFDLRFISGSSRSIDYHPQGRGFSESKYEVGYVLYSKTQFGSHESFNGIKIHSSTIAKWLGNTQKQEQIIKAYEAGNLFQENINFTEFSCMVPSIGLAGVAYEPTIFHSSPEFKAGIVFPPSFFLYSHDMSAEKAIKLISHSVDFFRFITGGNVKINKIELLTDGSIMTISAFLYSTKFNANNEENECIFFPLGKDLRFDQLGLPALTPDSLVNFLAQDPRKNQFFKQYLKYREVQNEEEKFLGFFRILEALAYKKGNYLDENALSDLIDRAKPYLVRKFGDKKKVSEFLNRVPRWNTTKYNTEKCIVDLLKTIPATASGHWRYSATDIAAICKLRNDITHANDYEASTATIVAYTKFIEVLLVYSLLVQIGIPHDSSAEILNRLNGYRLIQASP